MAYALAALAAALYTVGYLAGRTRPLQELGYRLHGWGDRNSSRELPWYRKYASDALGFAWIGLLFATHPVRTWRRLREYRNPTPRPPAPMPNPVWPDNLKEN